MNKFADRYDWIGEFHQGVAIVKKNEKYGAIMIGGKEIFPPIYDHLSNFVDGYATATYLGEDRTVNLSGQIQVKNGPEFVFLPEEYDWGFDYYEGICVVVKEGKYGIIDANYKILIVPSYTSFSGFNNGYAFFGNITTCVIDTHCNIIFSNVKKFNNFYFRASLPLNPNLFGLINNNLNIIIPFEYKEITKLNDKYLFVKNEKGNYVVDYKGKELFEFGTDDQITIKDVCFVVKKWQTTRIISFEGKELLHIKSNEIFQDIRNINDFYYVINTNKENRSHHYIISKSGKTIVNETGNLNVYFNSDYFYYRSVYGVLFKIDDKGNIQLLKTFWNNSQLSPEIVKKEIVLLKGKQVPSDYLHYRFTNLSDGLMSVCDTEGKLYGLANQNGDLLIRPKYGCLVQWKEYSYIVSILDKSELVNGDYSSAVHRFGIIDKTGKILLPFDYSFLGILIPEKIIAYSQTARITGAFTFINSHVSNNNNHQYGQPFSEGLLNSDLSVICTPQYYKIEKIDKLDYFKVTDVLGKWWGVIDYNGKVILPMKYRSISCSDKPIASFLVHGTYESSFSRNYVNEKGDFVVSTNDGKTISIPSSKYDWCGDFNQQNFALVERHGLKGKINTKGELVSLSGNKQMVVPQEYSWAYDFKFGYAIVCQNFKWGAVDSNFDLIIPCKYDYLDVFIEGFFRFKMTGQGFLGIIDKNDTVIADSEYRQVECIEKRYFKLSKSSGPSFYNVSPLFDIISMDGKKVLPHPCCDANMETIGNKDVWIATNDRKKGVCCDGKEIVPFIYDNITIKDERIICTKDDCNKEEPIQYNSNGEVIIRYHNSEILVPSDYSVAMDSEIGLFRVKNDEGWGLINLKKELIVPTKYSYISEFVGTYAIIGEGKKVSGLNEKSIYDTDVKYGIINTSGVIVIESKYSDIVLYKNGFIGFRDKELMGVMSSDLSILIPPSYHYISELGKQFFIVHNSDHQIGLLSCNNEVIISYGEFDEIEELSTGLLKLTKHTCFDPYVKIANVQGEFVIGDDDSFEDVTEVYNGLMMAQKKEYYDCRDDAYYNVYNLYDVKGSQILPYFCKEIHFLENGYLSIKGDKGWGIADVSGNILIEPNYTEELNFENNVSEINVKGSALTQKINKEGRVIVHNGNNSIELPDSVYWGTNYINRVSIVRGKGRGNNVIGVADLKGKVIVPTQYLCVSLLSNKTIRVQDGDCYGIFDLKGNVIFPPVFTSIEYINQDRIKVTWNLSIITEWNRHEYTKISNYKGYGNDYLVKNRSALCNLKAEIVNDKEILFIGKFINGYARAYKEITIEDERVQMKQVGVIDTSGETIIPLIYDGIVIYEDSSYIRVRKDGKFGIAHLKSKTVKMFNELDIKHMWEIDEFGRCVYSTDCKYSNKSEDWIGGTRGVLNENGILVPAGKYNDIDLLENGLIIVSNENGVGLLDKKGYEILPMKYSYISSFKGNYATICLGGEPDDYYNKIIGGKWGVIDSSGKIIKECVSDNEEVLEEKNSDNIKTNNQTAFEEPSVIIYDRIPEAKERSSYDDYDYSRDDYDDGPYSKYGGYNGWDDDTIDEAFDGNPELTWNVD